jgi:branched-chain amino acid aminotransferase
VIIVSECFRKFFVKDNEILNCDEFLDSNINEGTSLYEVIRIIDSVPIFLERHLERLQNSAAIVDLQLWMSIDEIKEKMLNLIRLNSVTEGNIKIVFNYNKQNTFLAYFLSHHYPSDTQYKEGVSTIFCFKERTNPNAKIINNDLRKLTDERMKEAGAYEAILVDSKGNITEGSRSNIFMVRENTVLTAPLSDVLPGITREIIIQICRDEKIKFLEERVNYSHVDELDGLFITGTSPKVLPINKIDDFVFNSSTNIIVKKIMRHYNSIISDYIINNR